LPSVFHVADQMGSFWRQDCCSSIIINIDKVKRITNIIVCIIKKKTIIIIKEIFIVRRQILNGKNIPKAHRVKILNVVSFAQNYKKV